MITILFIAANPCDTTRLALDREYSEIDKRLRASKNRESFKLAIAPAMNPHDLTNALLRFQPSIVHFSGHGDRSGGIVLANAQNQAVTVPISGLTTLFDVFSDRVRCVLLNACYSEPQAREIAKRVDCVIGMQDAVGDAASIVFAETFYDALAHGESVHVSFSLATNAIVLHGLKGADLTRLLMRDGVDATVLRFSDAPLAVVSSHELLDILQHDVTLPPSRDR